MMDYRAAQFPPRSETDMRFIRFSAIVVLLLCPGAAAFAQTPVPLTINGNEATGLIQLASYIAELKIGFEQADGRTTESHTDHAQIVRPFDRGVILRLSTNVKLAVDLTVLLQIDAANNGGLSFPGIAYIELHKHNLPWVPTLPLFLNSADNGG